MWVFRRFGIVFQRSSPEVRGFGMIMGMLMALDDDGKVLQYYYIN